MFSCFGCKKVVSDTVHKPNPVIRSSLEQNNDCEVASVVKINEVSSHDLNGSASTKVDSVSDNHPLRNSNAFSMDEFSGRIDVPTIIVTEEIAIEPFSTTSRPISATITDVARHACNETEIFVDDITPNVFDTTIKSSNEPEEDAFLNIVSFSVQNILSNCYKELDDEHVSVIKEFRPFSATPPGTIEDDIVEEEINHVFIKSGTFTDDIDIAHMLVEEKPIDVIESEGMSPRAFRHARELKDSMTMSEQLSESRPTSASKNLNGVPCSTSVLSQRIGGSPWLNPTASRRGGLTPVGSSAIGTNISFPVSAGALNVQPLRKGNLTASMTGLPSIVNPSMMN